MEATNLSPIETKEIDAHPESEVSVRKRSKEFILFCRVQGAMRHIPDFPETCKAILDAVMDEMDAENWSAFLREEAAR